MQYITSVRFTGVFIGLLAVSLLFVTCKKDDMNPTELPISSFQYAINPANFLEVTFTNFSQNATVYAWNFGDGNTSTDKDPKHTYAAAGTYTVSLKASNAAGENATRNETITIVDPDQTLALLAGTSSKTWYLQRQGIALGIGPIPNDNAWWSFGGVTPLGDRPCILDDKYIFHRDGRFEFNSNNTLFIDSKGNGGWLAAGVAEGCHDESEPGVFTAATGEDVSAFNNGGDYTYEFDGNAKTLTLLGLGAYIGLPNKTSAGDNYIPISAKTYKVFNFKPGAIADSLQISIVADNNGFSWNFYLVSYKNTADLPAIPGPKPKASFEFVKTSANTVEFTNTSTNASMYIWEFGDGATSTELSPTHTYSADGAYTVKLTAIDGMGQMDSKTADITISAAVFSAAALSSSTGKVWRLAGVGSFKVGPSAGSGEWYTADAQAVTDRPCLFNDEFIFTDGGGFKYDTKGDIWYDDYLGGMFTCANESVLQAPYNVFVTGNHTFTVGTNPNTIKVIGKGAFLGIPKAFNGGELNFANMVPAANDITYTVLDYSKVGNDETIVVTIDINGAGSAFWTFTLTTKL
ncbi:MAG: PKD domain-containing protein [Saprospiraceae bacterium]